MRMSLWAGLACVGLWLCAAEAGSPAQIEISVAKGKSTRLSGTDYDNKSQQFQCEVTVRNKEFRRSFAKLKATLVVVGKVVTSNMREVLDHQTSEFDLPLKGEHTFSGDPVTLDFDDNDMAQYGSKYEGFAVVIEDAEGAVLASKATKTSYLKHFDDLRKMNKGTRFRDNFASGSR